jgi:molybdate transport system regulatory protein
MARLTLRVDLDAAFSLGPGKIRLLELVRDTGSISAAGRAMAMSYRRAWLLVDALNAAFREPVVATKLGGKAGGGAALTPFGAELVAQYRAMEREAATAVEERIATLVAALAGRRER